jgi:hypothetical protein
MHAECCSPTLTQTPGTKSGAPNLQRLSVLQVTLLLTKSENNPQIPRCPFPLDLIDSLIRGCQRQLHTLIFRNLFQHGRCRTWRRHPLPTPRSLAPLSPPPPPKLPGQAHAPPRTAHSGSAGGEDFPALSLIPVPCVPAAGSRGARMIITNGSWLQLYAALETVAQDNDRFQRVKATRIKNALISCRQLIGFHR